MLWHILLGAVCSILMIRVSLLMNGILKSWVIESLLISLIPILRLVVLKLMRLGVVGRIPSLEASSSIVASNLVHSHLIVWPAHLKY